MDAGGALVEQGLAQLGGDLHAHRAPPLEDHALRSTTLAVVATNVTLTKTALTKLVGVRHPVVQTGMGWVAGPRLVSAVA